MPPTLIPTHLLLVYSQHGVLVVGKGEQILIHVAAPCGNVTRILSEGIGRNKEQGRRLQDLGLGFKFNQWTGLGKSRNIWGKYMHREGSGG